MPRQPPSPWNGTRGRISTRINGNFKRAKGHHCHHAASLMSESHPGLITQMFQHHSPRPPCMKKSFSKNNGNGGSPRNKNRTTPAKHPEISVNPLDPLGPLDPALLLETDKEASEEDESEEEDNPDLEKDNPDLEKDDAPDLPSTPGLMTQFFQKHSPPPTSCRKTFTEPSKPSINPGTLTAVFLNPPNQRRSQKKLTPRPRTATITPSPRRIGSVHLNPPRPSSSQRRMYPNKQAPRVVHCLPGQPSLSDQLGSWSGQWPSTRRKLGRRSSMKISMQTTNTGKRLQLSNHNCTNRFLQTTVGSLLKSPINECVPFEREWGNQLNDVENRVASGASSPGQRERGSQIVRSSQIGIVRNKQRTNNKTERRLLQQQADRQRIAYRARNRGDIH